jgi:hypothetical protein
MDAAATLSERNVSIGAGLGGTLIEAAAEVPYPSVLLLHGFGGDRNEVGGLFARLAERLALRGVSSLRIDFPGCGESAGEFAFATADGYARAAVSALRHLHQLRQADSSRVGLLGYSFGAAIATACLAEQAPKVRALALWAPVGDPKADMIELIGSANVATAERAGAVTLDWGGRKLRLNRAFFASLSVLSPLTALAEFDGDLFAAAGSRDRFAKYVSMLCAVARRARRCDQLVIDGADHAFNALDPGSAFANRLLDDTVSFFAATLMAR